MARMHTRRRGRSGSKQPSSSVPPMWLPQPREEIIALIEQFAKAGATPTKIGATLRDTYGVPSVRRATGQSISNILQQKGLAKEFPTDLLDLIRRAVRLRDHIARHKGDTYARTRLQRTESKIRRLAKYYTRTRRIPCDWTYEPERAALLVR